MTTKGKTKRKPKATRKPLVDLEAIGLVLMALGVFLTAILVPVLPTGEVGPALRELFAGRIGWGAYALPWPFVALGGLFLLRRNPKGWPRVLVGYTLLCFGVWLLVMLATPGASGSWGERLRTVLAGATGGLAYLLGFFIVTLGLERIFGWPATSLTLLTARHVVGTVRASYKGFLAGRRHLKTKAVFGADVVLARRDLKRLGGDLEALSALYPGSAELSRWRKAVETSRRTLASPNDTLLSDAQADITAWQNAVEGFTRDRAAELTGNLMSEGIDEFADWTGDLERQLDDPIGDPISAARHLDDLRKTLDLDLTALVERYRRLTRERDLDAAGLGEVKPKALVGALECHHARLVGYQQLAETMTALGQDAELLGPWRDFSLELSQLERDHPGSAQLNEYTGRLVASFKEQRCDILPDLPRWQEELTALAPTIRQGAAPPPELDEASWDTAEDAWDADAFTNPAPLETPSPGGARAFTHPATPPDDVDDPDDPDSALDALVNDPDDLPEVGGIPIQLPRYDLLDESPQGDESPAAQAQEVRGRITKIDETLNNFRLQGRVVASVRGPAVTRFEVEPAPGEKISRFANLSDDLALAMAVGGVRIEAPIPGKSVIGLEVPNAHRDLIRFREAAEAPSFRRSRARLPLILGKSIDGDMVIADLAKMPHLLIAGSTGSGKSVAVNTLVGSLLYKFLPTELRFLMIDPKMVELTPYDGVPHLVRPVVTNPNDAAGVLLGTVAHMERRYKMMSKIGAKTLDQYNEKARNLDMSELPHMVIIIDELADLMITSPKEVEGAIMRLAQMARATGMHLILATQRPSVDILTSLIKVNIPARVAFAVSSGHDSRTILDTMGAERLIGMGDMLYYQPGLAKPVRLQGPYISESEIASISSFMRRQFFDDDFVEAYGSDFDPAPTDDSSASGLIDWDDDKLREAAELVINEGQASVSRLQRRLSVGHARAGKLMDSLEALNVVGPHTGSKPREVLVSYEELPNIFGK